MCKKLFDSLICNVAFFLISLAGLAATSGIALRLGATLKSQQEPDNTEYSFYASESGFFVGVKSCVFLQWITAGFVTMFVKLNVSHPNEKLCDRLIAIYLQNFLLFAVFGALHYFSLPMSVLDEAKCTDFQEQIIKSKELRPKNPLCKEDHTWDNLFIAFFAGAAICFAGFLLLQTIYLFLGAACETETAPNVEVAEPAPIGTIIEMMSMPAHDVALQPRLPYAQ